MAVANGLSSVDNSIVPTKDAVPGRGGSNDNAVKPLASTVVLMNMSDVSTTSFLVHASLCKTTF